MLYYEWIFAEICDTFYCIPPTPTKDVGEIKFAKEGLSVLPCISLSSYKENMIVLEISLSSPRRDVFIILD